MAELFAYTLEKPARALFASIVTPSAPKNVANATPRCSGTFGVEEEDWKNIQKFMVRAIESELGSFSGSPGDYFLCCTRGETAAVRAIQKAEFDAAGKQADEAFKIKEKAEARAKLYREHHAILMASSNFEVSTAKLDGGRIVDINGEIARKQAEKDLFYPGAWMVPAVAFKAFRRKKLEDKDGVTAYLQNCLFIRKGERIGGGGAPDNQSAFKNYQNYSSYDPTAGATTNSDLASEPQW